MVYFTCKLIQADEFLGAHESILPHQEAQTLVRTVSQKRGVDLMSSPSVATRFNQRAQVEVAREVLPNGGRSGEPKFVGLSIKLIAQTPVQGKSTIETKVDLGVDPDSASPLVPNKDKAADWDKVSLHTVSSKATLASGETLLLQLPTSKRPVTALITATARKPDGTDAATFAATTMKAPPASQGRDMPKDAKKEEWAVREYRVPATFGDGKPPVEYLESNGIVFPPGAMAEMVKGKLTVRNTKDNLDLIEVLIEFMLTAGLRNNGQIQLMVHAVDVKADRGGLMELILPEMKKQPTAATELPLNVRHQLTVAGVLTEAQFQVALRTLTKSDHKPATLPKATVKGGEEAVFNLPAGAGGARLEVSPVIGPDGSTVELAIAAVNPTLAAKSKVTTGITIWNGQTVMMAGEPLDKDKTMRVIFITATLVDPAGDPVKK